MSDVDVNSLRSQAALKIQEAAIEYTTICYMILCKICHMCVNIVLYVCC